MSGRLFPPLRVLPFADGYEKITSTAMPPHLILNALNCFLVNAGMVSVRKTIFVVDDEPDIVELITYNLEREGFKALGFTDSVEVVEKAEQLKPDLIILDVMMPDLDGFELCKRLRANPETAKIPVMFLTARTGRSIKSLAWNSAAMIMSSNPYRRASSSPASNHCFGVSASKRVWHVSLRPRFSASVHWKFIGKTIRCGLMALKHSSQRKNSSCWPSWQQIRTKSSRAINSSTVSGVNRCT